MQGGRIVALALRRAGLAYVTELAAGGLSLANARRTAFREISSFLEIALITIPSDRCNRRISAQSSTVITPTGSVRGFIFNRRYRVSLQPTATPYKHSSSLMESSRETCGMGSTSSMPSGAW